MSRVGGENHRFSVLRLWNCSGMAKEINNPVVMNNLNNESVPHAGAALGGGKAQARDGANRAADVSVSLNAPLKRPVMEEHDPAVLKAAGTGTAPVVIVLGNKTPATERVQLAKSEVERALEQAELAVKPFLLHRELKAAKADLAKGIDIESCQQKVSKIAAELQKCGQGKYAQTTKAIHYYASAVIKLLECEIEAGAKKQILTDSIKTVETLMCGPDNLYKGIPGKTPDIPRFQEKDVSETERLSQLELHLREKISKMDGDQAQRLRCVESLPVFVDLLNRTSVIASRNHEDAILLFDDEGKLIDARAVKSDEECTDTEIARLCSNGIACGAIIVKRTFDEEGKAVELPERNGVKMSRPVFARMIEKVVGKVPATMIAGSSFDLANDAFAVFFREDGSLVLDHGTELPKPVDIVRLRKAGIGPEGGGFHRFIDENIIGMAIVMKKYNSNGQPLQIKGTNGLIAKEVVEVIGVVPTRTVQNASGATQEIPLVKPGTSYGNLLKTFRERNKLLQAGSRRRP